MRRALHPDAPSKRIGDCGVVVRASGVRVCVDNGCVHLVAMVYNDCVLLV